MTALEVLSDEELLTPFMGVAHVAYLPDARILGLSKLARAVEMFSRGLQTRNASRARSAGHLC